MSIRCQKCVYFRNYVKICNVGRTHVRKQPFPKMVCGVFASQHLLWVKEEDLPRGIYAVSEKNSAPLAGNGKHRNRWIFYKCRGGATKHDNLLLTRNLLSDMGPFMVKQEQHFSGMKFFEDFPIQLG